MNQHLLHYCLHLEGVKCLSALYKYCCLLVITAWRVQGVVSAAAAQDDTAWKVHGVVSAAAAAQDDTKLATGIQIGNW